MYIRERERERERNREIKCRTNVSHIAHAMNENVCNIAKICKKYQSTHKSIIEHECTEMYKNTKRICKRISKRISRT